MEVAWIKLSTRMLESPKIKHIRRLPSGNNIVLIWVMLLTMAGRCNAEGRIFLTEDIPYTPKTLADELTFKEKTIALALQVLEEHSMITRDPLSIKNWEKYQNTGRLAEIREYNREKQRESRARKKQRGGVNDMSMTCQRGQDTDIEIATEPDSEETEEESSFPTESPQYLLASFLGERIHMRLPSTEPPDEKQLHSWADAFDKCSRIDGHPWDEIKLVLKFSQDDAFWQTVILSGEKFREKYVQLLAKMTIAHKGGPSKPSQEASVDRVARLLKEGAFAK